MLTNETSSTSNFDFRPQTDDVTQFFEAIGRSAQLWKSIDLRIAAVRRDGKWFNLMSRCRLEFETPDAVERLKILPRLDEFIVLQVILPLEALPRIIDGVQAGKLVLDEHTVFFPSENSGSLVGGYQSSSVNLTARVDNMDTYASFPYGHTLTLRGTTAGTLIDAFYLFRTRINSQLRNLDHPWVDLNTLMRYGIGMPQPVDSNSTLYVSFIAPLEAKLEMRSCQLSHGKLQYSVVASNREVCRATILKVFGNDQRGKLISKSVPLGGKRWKRVAKGHNQRGIVGVSGGEKLTLMLRLGSEDCGEKELRDQTFVPPALLSAARALNEADDFEQHLLDPSSNQGKEFERAVSRLFTLCGFLVEPIGNTKRNDLPDALAAVPGTNVVFVIECTIGPMAKDGKMARLRKRAVVVQNALESAPHGVAIPLMVTPSRSSEISAAESDHAERDGVICVGQEKLRSLLNLAMRRASIEEIFQQLAPQPRWGARLELSPHELVVPPDISGAIVFTEPTAQRLRPRHIR